MGLKIWMPLTGNLNNLGTASVTTAVSGTTSYTNGKIGQCLSCNGSSFWTVTGIELGEEASICCWTKTTANNKMSWVLTATSYTSLNLYEASYYSLNKGDGNNNKFLDSNGSDIACLHDGVWHHFAVTFGSSVAKLYIDGVYRGTAPNFRSPATTSAKTIKIAGGFTGGHQYDWNGGINDFRVYDHCISPKEVKDISKGLVLHYPLNNPYIENTENYLGTKSIHFEGYWGSYGFGSRGIITTATNQTAKYGGDVAILTNKTTDTTKKNTEMATVFKEYSAIMNKGDSFTMTAWVKGNGSTVGRACYAHLYNANSTNTMSTSGPGIILTNEWKKVSHTLTWAYDTPSYDSGNCYVYASMQGGESIYICNVQVEKKDHATPFTEDVRTRTTITDNSGFGYDGTISGDITIFNDSERYLTSTYFNGSSVVKDNTFSFTSAQWSVSFWYKFTTRPSAYQGFLCLSRNAGADADKKFAAMPNSTYIWFKFENTTYTLSSLKLNEWCHIVMTCDGTNGKVYENGILKGTTSAISSIYTNCDDFVVGGRATASDASSVGVFLNGYMNDVRVYATALSEDDIKELYNTPANIDNLGNFHSFEFVEDGGPSIQQNGDTKSDNFIELPSEYSRVEYIQSVGATQYIDTLIPYYSSDTTYEIECDAEMISPVNYSYQAFYGTYVAEANSTFRVIRGNNNTSFLAYGNTKAGGGNTTLTVSTIFARYHIIHNYNAISLNGTSTTLTHANPGTAVSGTTTFCIFCQKNGSCHSNMKLYFFSLKDNGKYVRYFIPVKRKSDNKPGLYDTVSGTFFTNAGTGEFTLGPTVEGVAGIYKDKIVSNEFIEK